MKKIGWIALFLSAVLILPGCGSEEPPNELPKLPENVDGPKVSGVLKKLFFKRAADAVAGEEEDPAEAGTDPPPDGEED